MGASGAAATGVGNAGGGARGGGAAKGVRAAGADPSAPPILERGTSMAAGPMFCFCSTVRARPGVGLGATGGGRIGAMGAAGDGAFGATGVNAFGAAGNGAFGAAGDGAFGAAPADGLANALNRLVNSPAASRGAGAGGMEVTGAGGGTTTSIVGDGATLGADSGGGRSADVAGNSSLRRWRNCSTLTPEWSAASTAGCSGSTRSDSQAGKVTNL